MLILIHLSSGSFRFFFKKFEVIYFCFRSSEKTSMALEKKPSSGQVYLFYLICKYVDLKFPLSLISIIF